MSKPDITKFETIVQQVIRLQNLQDSLRFNFNAEDQKINSRLIDLINQKIDRLEKELADD
tara:strand:+ start:1000 stop:1179 length:180 start_codon:yes stop_codon:yes gene_type:complete